ncbi:3'(2'),5'-bisphosphate nucleotidase CysQ [Abyssibius alkaniclasticus]|uniref:3'(2'),5'-bisphosphate nucleotidase CysQ n=1 Tax=Abyssibius alkaniclasticus TaxID=2881234 RepID=UPI004058CA13
MLDHTIVTLRKLALEAGAEIMRYYQSDEIGLRLKDDQSPLTAADEAADAIISAGLRKAFPDSAVVTEEQADSHSQHHTRFFIVDPLDGTKEFVQKRGDFTVNIALVEHGAPVAGVVYAPARQRLFLTGMGCAYEEIGPFDATTPGALNKLELHVPAPDALIIVASKSHRDAATDAYIAQYPVGDFRAAGSSLKFCLLAAGEADLYPRLGRTMEWDTAAGHAVLAAAGGYVLRADTLAPLTYGKPGYENPFFIAHVPGVTPRANG